VAEHQHVAEALAQLLDLLKKDKELAHLSPEARQEAIARGLVFAVVRTCRGLDPAAVVARLRRAADWIEQQSTRKAA
jgi:Tfp pilus assembly protein PilO